MIRIGSQSVSGFFIVAEISVDSFCELLCERLVTRVTALRGKETEHRGGDELASVLGCSHPGKSQVVAGASKITLGISTRKPSLLTQPFVEGFDLT